MPLSEMQYPNQKLPPMDWIRVYHNVQNDDYPIHWHTSIELIMPYVNYYEASVNGERLMIKPGDILVIPPGELHELFAPDEGERLIVLFDYSLFSNLRGLNSLLDSLHPRKLITREDYPSVATTLTNCLKEIEFEYFQDNAYREASIYYMLVNFLVTLGRADLEIKTPFEGIPEKKQHEYVNKFLAVCNYINENYTHELPVEKICEMTGLTRSHFSKLFEQFTGMSYNDYLCAKRISFAEKLLIYPGISTTDVSMQCGFKSLSSFNRAFRAIKHCSPTEYRSLNLQRYDTNDPSSIS